LNQPTEDTHVVRRQTGAVGAALALTTILLLALGFVDYRTGRGIEKAHARVLSADTVRVQLIGHQWWWEIRYQQATWPFQVTTANELHIPLGRPVVLTLESRDVIHSFWAPNLHGKSDLVPGYSSQFLVQADTPGVYAAPCAEFCGTQHAKMMLLVVAQPPDSFAAWYANESRDAPAPRSDSTDRGRQVFLAAACPFCHTIRGTGSGGTVAPDLTHIAGRRMLGAGAAFNTRTELGGWIENPQGMKPGNRMPANLVRGSDLPALLAYLATLK
jgi:cytochrome c oxidase subunit 2